ncbi:MAG: anhydro-N-acetylmuramic acid kinase [Candidatus Midichloria sp.]|nr:anhydro-N-acetylmuramic acid kinase [Candidatus Midichloria sp.]
MNNTIFLNIGGVSNITYIDKEEIIAFDAGPGNAIIDDFLYKRAAIFLTMKLVRLEQEAKWTLK